MNYTVTSNKYEWALANLRALRRSGKQIATSSELNIGAADVIGLSESQKLERSSNGKLRFIVVSEWSRTFLKEVQLFKRAGHGKWTTASDRAGEVDSVDYLKELERRMPSKKHFYINTETLSELLAKISFPSQTPTPVNATNLLFNTLAVSHVLTNRGVTEVDLSPNTESRTDITNAYGRLVSVDPSNPEAGAINDLSVKPAGTTYKTPSSYISSGLYTAISRRTDDSPNTPGFALEGMIASVEVGLAEFERIFSQLKDDQAKTSFAVFSLRGLPIDNKELPLTAEKLYDAIEDAYGDDIARLITSTFRGDPPILITEENLSSLPGKIGEPSSTNKTEQMNHEQRLICALAAKPFVILAGGTGTGKTKSAIETVKKLCKSPADGKKSDQFEVIAVGADWTDTRPLLGYVNLLIENGPAYSPTAALQLILRAQKNPSLPHFLVLDEMNLSHVERYFSDFLSLMEAKNTDKSTAAIRLHSRTGGMKTVEGAAEPVPAEIPWPANLHVVGTVNIDETTYMFSPKVLDRAHVIEFKVTWGEIESGLERPAGGDVATLTPPQVDEFMRVAGLKDKTLSDEDHDALIEILKDIHEALDGTRFVFAHRTARECLNFIASAQALAKANIIEPQDTSALIDLAVLQKALPKLNGSAGTLSTVLDALIKVADKHDLKLSEKKLKSMQAQLKADQFVSFIQ